LKSVLDDVLDDRRTWREFGRQPLTYEALSTLLERTWAVQREGHAPGQGSIVLKTSPSGGACHPLEAYVLARRVDGLSPGLYHFESYERHLVELRRGATAADIARFLPGQPWFRTAHAVVFMTAVFARTAWRYDTARAYRGVILEAGHFCQTFLLLATSLNLAPFCTQAIADSAVERALRIDGVSESVLYAAGVGTRPGRYVPGLPKRFRRSS
jgi:SagB-type dehydrogenase family enzyme